MDPPATRVELDSRHADGAPAQRRRRLLELALVFAAGALLMHYFYGGNDAAEVGVPGNDSFYHVRMATLIPQHGWLKRFPWLQYAWFTEQGDAFVSHHHGFHLLLLPFVKLATWLGYDELTGARWAICTAFGLVMALFNALLMAGGVRFRMLWLALFLLLPFQFFTRHAYIRAISPALVFMLAILLAMFRQRPIVTAILVYGFTQLYLGAALYAPLIVLAYVAASVVGPSGDRRVPGAVALGALGGWLIGLLTHPYRDGMAEFLWLQVFGTGLTPDIEVGREWRQYNGVWWFAGQMSGPLLVVWTAAVVLRMRLGPALDARTTTLMLLNFAFLALTLKARRFIEFWPAFCLLSAAFAAAPPLAAAGAWLTASGQAIGNGGNGGGDDGGARRRNLLRPLAWTGLLGLALLATGVAVQTGAFAALGETPSLALVGVLLLAAGVLGDGLAPRQFPGRRAAHGAARLVAGVGLLGLVALVGGAQLQGIRRDARCDYDLPAIRAVMGELQRRSDPGDVVFTDDWDIFPPYFYYNTHNCYVVGLDPKFTHARRPDLWERYVKITRGQTPARAVVTVPGESGPHETTIEIALTDIRDHFGARWIVVDKDHEPLARKLDRAADFCALVWPERSRAAGAPYRLYRVREPGGATGERPAGLFGRAGSR